MVEQIQVDRPGVIGLVEPWASQSNLKIPAGREERERISIIGQFDRRVEEIRIIRRTSHGSRLVDARGQERILAGMDRS